MVGGKRELGGGSVHIRGPLLGSALFPAGTAAKGAAEPDNDDDDDDEVDDEDEEEDPK